MTFSLPNSGDDIFTNGWLYKLDSEHVEPKVIENTLWDLIQQSEHCLFFKKIVVKALAFEDFNNPCGIFKTLFIPIATSGIEGTPFDILNTLTLNTKLTLGEGPYNIKVQNNAKEYLSISNGIVLIFDTLYKIIVPNIQCVNGTIHICLLYTSDAADD